MLINIVLICVIILIICYNSSTIFTFGYANEKSLKETFIIDELYDGKSGFIKFDGNISQLYFGETTYGEVTNKGIDLLSEYYNKHGPLDSYKVDKKTFYDLGCGVGKIVVKMAYLNKTIQSVGYEIVPERVAIANEVIRKVDYDILERISIRQQDLFDKNVKLNDGCWIFISNLCLKEDKMKEFAKKLDDETPTGCVIICSKPIEFDKGTKFNRLAAVPVPMTWQENSECIIYKKN
jgi:SAM-dependent methyltransferase